MAKGDYLSRLLDNLGISEADMPSALQNMMDWSGQVRNIESDDNPMAAAGTTSAKGVYQFTDPSVETGLNRMETLGYSERPDWNPFSEEFIEGISQNPQEWDDEQADAMFFANMFSQSGSDPFLKEIAMGNNQARRDAYYQFHHTDPDEATTERTEKFIPVSTQPVDDTMAGYNNVESAFTK